MSDPVPPFQPVEVFISYAHEDKRLKDQLLPHLSPLQREGVITTWHDADISAGREWRAEIEAHLNSARIILLLISADFLDSDFCYDQEMRRAMGRHDAGSARVIPVFLRQCYWKEAPFGRLQGVPSDKPVASWSDKDESFTQVAQAVRNAAKELASTISRENEALIAEYLRAFLREIQTRIDQMLSLAARETASAVTPPERILRYITVSHLQPGRRPTPPIPYPSRVFDSFPAAFESLGGRVLLLGVPGAGKTTTLLQFACAAAQARLDDPTKPIPLFASLHRWDHQTPLSRWAQAPLHAEFPGISLQDQPLLYLLDGLDELGGERPVDPNKPEGEKYDPRRRLLAAVAEQLLDVPVVISCREQEYEQLGQKAALRGAVTLLPLEPEQIEGFLRAQNQAALWEVVAADVDLLELARTPLLLALLSSAVGEAPNEVRLDLGSATVHTLFDFYIKQRFLHEGQKRALPFDEPTTRALLGKLGAFMWHRSPWSWSPIAEFSFLEVEAVVGQEAQAFVAFACSMQFLRQAGLGATQFIHLKFRDYCAVPRLMEALRDVNSVEHWRAAESLGEIRDGAAVPALMEVLRDAGSLLHGDAARALVMIGQPSIAALVETLQTQHDFVSASAAQALGMIGDATAVPALAEALDKKINRSDRGGWVVWALRAIGQPSVGALVEALRAEDVYVRRRAAQALGEIRDAAAVPALMKALYEDTYVRTWALWALTEIGQPSVAPLVEALQEEDKDVRWSAHWALESIRRSR